MKATTPEILVGLALLAISAALIWFDEVGWAIIVFGAGGIAISLHREVEASKARQMKLKAERVGEGFDTFLKELNRPDYDLKTVEQVYTVLRWVSVLDRDQIALRPGDDWEKDLGIDADAIYIDLWEELKGPLQLVDTQEAINRNPFAEKLRTVADLIDFYVAQERVEATNSVS